MSWLRIVHETTYRYRTAVRFGPHRLILRPREGHDVHVEEMRLEIAPEYEIEWSRDVFGNSVATVHLLRPADELRICSDVLLQHTLPFPLRSSRPRITVPFPVRFSAFEADVAAAYRATTYPGDVGHVGEWTRRMVDPASVGSAEAVVGLVARTVCEAIRYRRREEPGVQSPGQTLASSSGSCRDLATLMMEVLRALGFPARFASGYLDCAASEAGHASTHAWAEAYLPEIGWIGFDPTLGEPTSAKHVVTGVSNHPRGVMPITGTFIDEQKSYLGMTVTVRTERHTEPPAHLRGSSSTS